MLEFQGMGCTQAAGSGPSGMHKASGRATSARRSPPAADATGRPASNGHNNISPGEVNVGQSGPKFSPATLQSNPVAAHKVSLTAQALASAPVPGQVGLCTPCL